MSPFRRFLGSIRNAIPEDLDQRIDALAAARNEDRETVIARFGKKGLRRCPNRFPGTMAYLRGVEFASAGMRDGLPYVVTAKGRTIYGPPSRPAHHHQFPFVADVISPVLTADTFGLALDVATRYCRDNFDEPFALEVKAGDTVVEAGAYVGHLSMWFAEKVGPSGRVIAIEMMPENVEILRRNVVENGLQEIVTVVAAGVWNHAGTRAAKTRGRQVNSFANITNVEKGEEVELPVDTLDNILDGCGIDSVDVAFITVNGAEVEVLEGFQRHLKNTVAMAIAANHAPNGHPSAPLCRDFLSGRGFEMLPAANPALVLCHRPL